MRFSRFLKHSQLSRLHETALSISGQELRNASQNQANFNTSFFLPNWPVQLVNYVQLKAPKEFDVIPRAGRD